MGQRYLEHSGVEVALHQTDGTAGHAQVADESLVAQRGQRVDRPAARHRVLEGHPLRVVQVQHLHAVEAQPLEALLDRGSHPRSGEVAGGRIRVYLGREDEVGGQPAASA